MSGQVEATAKLAPCPHCGELHGEDQLRCSKTDMMLPLEGRRLDGKFRFLSTLGAGGMASVWLARNERVDREVAIKFLRPEVGRDPEAVARFRSEARAAGRIGNKHICEILDLGDSPIGPYIVMERLRGIDLAGLIRRQGRLAPGYAVRIVRHALEGLAAAHAAGIVHRDLKPGNVFLHRTDGGDTQVKLMDFGVSKFLDGSGDALTASGILLGTPEYMAPEQLEGAHKLGPPSDIFAMGAILYRSITGQQVFSGANLAAVLRAMAVDKPTPVDQLIEGLPAELVAIIHRCLERDPAARFQTAEALSDALAPFEQFDGEVRVLQVPGRLDSAAPPPSRAPEPVPELLPSAIVQLEAEHDHDPDLDHGPHVVESATRVWKQEDASGPLRRESSKREAAAPDEPTASERSPLPAPPESRAGEPSHDPGHAEPTLARVVAPMSSESSSPTREPPRRRAAWPFVLVGVLALGVAAFFGRDWLAAQFGGSEPSLAAKSPDSSETAIETATSDTSDTSDTNGETGAVALASAGETSSSSGTGSSSETGTSSESEGDTEGETGSSETGEPDSGGGNPSEFSTDRPPPPGTFRAEGFITPNEPGPLGDQPAARKYCEGLAARRVAGVGKWRLANPSEAGNFIGSKVKSSRYWTSAAWQGKARVYTLPKGKKESEKVDKKIARPLCVSRW
ncbi:protein kinase domain-containing protein [Nannocystaceae bacterium ST9]